MTDVVQRRLSLPPAIRLGARPQALIVWGIWAAMTVGLVARVGRCGFNLPLWDEWQMVPYLLGRQPITWTWLWQPWGEHHVPMTRLLLLGLASLSGCDFRAPMILSVILLAGTSAALILTAKRLRGRLSVTDAFFPVVLLHAGHAENLLQGWNIQNVTACCLSLVVLIAIVMPGPFTAARGHTAGICLLLLPLNGAAGLGMAACLGVWLGWQAYRLCRSGSKSVRVPAVIVLLMALTALGLVPVYLDNLNVHAFSRPSLLMGLQGSFMFLSTAFGPATNELWPATGVAAALLLLAFGVTLGIAWIRGARADRILGLALFLVGVGVVAAGVGYGRASVRPGYCLHQRYAVLAAPWLCGGYFIGVTLADVGWPRMLQPLLLTLMVLVLPLNEQAGIRWSEHLRSWVRAFEQDVAAGATPRYLLKRYIWLVPRWSKEQEVDANYYSYVALCMRMLQHDAVGVYHQLRLEPRTFRTISLPIIPQALHDMTWTNGEGHGAGADAWVSFAIDPPQQVGVIQLECAIDSGDHNGPVSFEVSWEEDPAGKWGHTWDEDLDRGPAMQEVPVWVDKRIRQFRIRPDKQPCTFRLGSIKILVSE